MSRAVLVTGLVVLALAGLGAAGTGRRGITIAADPSIARWPSGTALQGRVSSGKAGERVKLEARQCPSRSFVTVGQLRTTDGGAWATETGVTTATAFRARWSATLSREVLVLARPHLVLSQLSRQRFRAVLLLGNQADGKRLVLQRFDEDDRGWKAVRAILFRNSGSAGYPQMTFSATAPKRATLRLTLPRAQAQPCHLGGYSNIVQT